MSTYVPNLKDKCIILSNNSAFQRSVQFLGIGMVLLILGEWKSAYRLTDVNWFTLHWAAFMLSVVSSTIVMIINGTLVEYPFAFIAVFAIDGKLINHPQMKRLMYSLAVILAITTISIMLAIQSSCEDKSLLHQFSINVSTSSVSYATVKWFEYAYYKFRHPNVNVLIEMHEIVENAFTQHGKHSHNLNPQRSEVNVSRWEGKSDI
eukprot:CAMPEP_0114521534 /NCGR_PEP_ID=MMETSP0109-20121206/20235_1 /TAXON_ID=29199 /ORGANISM="Chlorarachnion reptans, Strain CCCM449" /LENGTH=205 /DNA_ID=CAMNT_0001702641 /DNA_START=650 /DNA_END=1267 /DNA_ORIENTATION=+